MAAPDEREAHRGEGVVGDRIEAANATHIGGAPGTTVTWRRAIVSAAATGSKRCTSSTPAPTVSEVPITTASPKMWNNGKTP